MAIDKLLQESSFSPNEVANITAAYEAALVLLRLEDRNDPITERIAEKIIAIARSGEQDPPSICARAIHELGLPVPDWSIASQEQRKPETSSFRWREALLLLVIGALCGYVVAQMTKPADHAAVLAQCKLQEQTSERIDLCMRAAGYEFSDTQCGGAEIVSERQRLTNAAEINAARLAILDPFIEQYLQKHPGQSRTMAELMVRDAAKEELEKRQPAPKFETVVTCYKRHRSKAIHSN